MWDWKECEAKVLACASRGLRGWSRGGGDGNEAAGCGD